MTRFSSTKVRTTFYSIMKPCHVKILLGTFLVFYKVSLPHCSFQCNVLFVISFFQISVKDMKGRMFEFPVKDWIDAKEGIFAQTEYALSSNGFHDEPIKPPAKPNPFGLSEYRSIILFINSCEVSCDTIFLQM